MKFNKLILISLFLVIVSLSAVSAADNVNLTDDNPTLTVDSDDVGHDLTIEDNEIQQVNSEKADSIVITNETFSNYFDSEGRLLDSVEEGSTLDFQGSIEASDNIKAIYINKSVNIISTTKDATITLNTVNATLGIEHIDNRFIVSDASSITIKDVTFNRTQMLIYDSSNVILDNISVISDNYKICQYSNYEGRKTPFLRFNNVDGVTLKNSYFYVFNIGATIINCNETKTVLFDNNTFCGYADSIDNNKSFYYMILFSYVDTSFNFINNKVHANSTHGDFCSIKATCILFENNTFEHPDADHTYSTTYMRALLGESDKSNTIVRNNIGDIYIGVSCNSTIYNNNLEYGVKGQTTVMYNNTLYSAGVGKGGIAYNNTVGSLHLYEGSISYNNTVIGSVYITQNDVILKDSVMGGLRTEYNKINITIENNNILGDVAIESSETFVQNNIINGHVSISSKGATEIINNIINGSIHVGRYSTICNNVVNALSSDYAIDIARGGYYINNEIYNNKLYSRLYCGDNAVFYDTKFTDGVVRNLIYDNTPETQIDIFLNTTVNTFDYDENTTVIVNMPNITGNVAIDVDGQKYVVELVNGSASQIITKYSLGINNIAVIYEDTENDIWAINHTTFTVNKVSHCPVELKFDDNISEGKVSQVNVILPDDADGNISITLTNGLNNLDIKQVAKGRENKIILPGLFEGNYSLSASFSSVKYVTNSTIVNISVVHIPVYELTAGNVVMDYKDGSKYKVLVTKDGKAVGAGEVVKITFNGKTKDVKTDKDGYATLTLDAAPKTYTIKAVYNGVTKSTKVTIKNILKASNISKKKTKKIKFSATLKNSKGKAIVGKKVKFKFKGKNYSAKTNKKGVATITLRNLKVGKYTIASKYCACAVKNTIIIKK